MRPSLQPATPRSGDTDFGREIHGETLSLAEAVRKRTSQIARAEAISYQLAMGLIGFFGGLILVLPMVLWLASTPRIATGDGGPLPSNFVEASTTGGAHAPSLRSAPTIADRAATLANANREQEASGAVETENQIEAARGLIRASKILAARRLLERPELRASGQALFMLAETYDPNVLAALGATGVVAESQIARRYYEAALAEGVEAAAPRLEALE